MQCKLNGGTCAEPQSKYESFHKTMMAARERARKTSNFLSGSARSSMRKTSAKGKFIIKPFENNSKLQ